MFKYFVNEEWEEVYGNDNMGKVTFGSLDALVDAFSQGREIKVGIKDLCSDLNREGEKGISYEVFIHCGSCYYYTESKVFCAGSHPLVRVRPSIPLKYESDNWNFGWLMLRSDGKVAMWLVDPHTLKFNRKRSNYAIRWFVR